MQKTIAFILLFLALAAMAHATPVRERAINPMEDTSPPTINDLPSSPPETPIPNDFAPTPLPTPLPNPTPNPIPIPTTLRATTTTLLSPTTTIVPAKVSTSLNSPFLDSNLTIIASGKAVVQSEKTGLIWLAAPGALLSLNEAAVVYTTNALIAVLPTATTLVKPKLIATVNFDLIQTGKELFALKLEILKGTSIIASSTLNLTTLPVGARSFSLTSLNPENKAAYYARATITAKPNGSGSTPPTFNLLMKSLELKIE